VHTGTYNFFDILIALADETIRIPIAIQWMFPTPLAILLYMAPESPWWLVRKGRLEEAEHAVGRLGRRSRLNLKEAVSMMRRTIDLESVKEPSIIELFKGTDRYRTLIVCGVYAAQNLTGNLIANQAVYFFEQAGMKPNTAFALGLITSALQWIFVMLSWILTSYLGRRTIYVWGSLVNVVFLVALGVAGECLVPGTGLPRSHRLRAVHARSCARIVGHHRRNLVHSSASSYHWYRTWRVLCCQHPLHFPR
jgi:SP family general alpha glucoside:H+ symporter-like MFS transporter